MRAPRKVYPFAAPPELYGERRHHRVVIVGGGPVGMAAARDLALHHVASIVLDDDDQVSVGSRAICWAKRTLEIFDRLGCAAPMAATGVTWNTGKVFFGDDREPLFEFDLLRDREQCFPAFVNLPQCSAEEYLVGLLERTPLTELRWQSKVTGIRERGDCVELTVATPAGSYTVTADYVIAADGCHSSVRTLLGLPFDGKDFQDHFLIVDVRMQAERPAERWFWFDPPFARGQSALLHKQPDNIWRLDFQLGPEVDRALELDQRRISERVRRMLGEEHTRFEIEWSSIYTFQCRRLERFVHGRVIFAGDAAHVMSPFGARGANSGIQDIDNLCWKLALVLKGIAPPTLLETYSSERVAAATENILQSARSSEFIAPKTPLSRTLRDATLQLARRHAFARAFVNSGRLSTPYAISDSPLSAPDCDRFGGSLAPGSVAPDARILSRGSPDWFLRQLGGRFALLAFDETSRAVMDRIDIGPDPQTLLHVTSNDIDDCTGKLCRELDARPGSCYLFRPDQHLQGRWRTLEPGRIRAAVRRACGLEIAS